MFEEICIVCGKDVPHQMTIYCSRVCQNADSSPSAASSACSSPCSFPDDPGDMPALSIGHSRGRASISSSSASSWSLATDELDDNDSAHIRSDNDLEDVQQLSYARKPSRTTNQSIVPILLSRSSSDSSSSDGAESIIKTTRRLPTSLPAYFSSLTISPPKKPMSTVPSAHTVSPPTPKVPMRSFRIPNFSPSSLKGQPAAPALTPPIARERGRGRRRRSGDNDASDSPSHTRTRRSSPSRSHSRSRSLSSQHPIISSFNWQLSKRGEERRGRARVEDLNGLGSSEYAPGYGCGRSGLLHRSRDRGAGAHGSRY